jgi:hypothetical protein
VAGFCKHGDEPSSSDDTELVLYRRMKWRKVNDELQKIWKEAIVAKYQGIALTFTWRD